MHSFIKIGECDKFSNNNIKGNLICDRKLTVSLFSDYSSNRERAWREIDLDALSYNVRQIKTLLSSTTELMAIVKADAYGHGAEIVAKTVLKNGANWLGVATISEGVELRRAGINAPILLLGATNTPEQIRTIADWKIQPTISTPKQALIFSETLSKTDRNFVLPVHLNIDTGMSRIGIPHQQTLELVQFIKSLSNIEIASIYSHFATADEIDSSIMHLQHIRYKKVVADLKNNGISLPKLHIANSAATLTTSDTNYDLVRVGLALYGIYPASHLSNKIDLKPVLQVKARITQIKTIHSGDGVSYGHRYIANKEMRIAVVSIGYADGVSRNLSNRMIVLLQGQQITQIGAITMDQLMLDVSMLPKVKEGDVVTLIGKDQQNYISVEDWASKLNTISWEILCTFKSRLPRILVGQHVKSYQDY